MYDERTVDDVVLALLHLSAFKDGDSWRAWKGFDWGALVRLLRHLLGVFQFIRRGPGRRLPMRYAS